MIIVFANQKGGVGKSTHCALFAHYLSEQNKEVHVVDMDFQKTLDRKRMNDLSLSQVRDKEESAFDNPLSYSVESIPPESAAFVSYVEKAFGDKKAVYLFDTPGNLNNSNTVRLLGVADFIIVPFNYEETILDSTAVFIQVVEKFRIEAKMMFLPTNVDARVKFSIIEDINKLLSSKGVVTPVSRQRADIKFYSTLSLTKTQRELVKPVYDFMYKQLYS
ncbi:MAG: ParA family protein [Tannerella sp.]|jgi:chromosome partitioning protein|nr:ParA family protein [Tannerella sp.]